ncbi:MAG: tetratricopeptide repeat protein [Sterolibacterium sp.]|jgi:predicted RNA methylase|nr:tetratricopeptide repeat protein [Sterolibacterium sp.]
MSPSASKKSARLPSIDHANEETSCQDTEALDICQERVHAQPNNARHRFALALALNQKGHTAQALSEYRIALQQQPDFAEAHCNLGLLLQEQGLPGAEEALRRACELAPENRHFATNLRLLMSGKAPMWHFSMMNDLPRAIAYETALQRALRPDDHVLDIGTGSGLLSMMAARAGAQRVTSCESVPEIATQARQIIATNGYSDHIEVIAQPSSNLKVPDDLPKRANLLVSEIFSSEVIGEGALPSFEHARKHLLEPDARIIPAQAWVVGQLAGAEALESYLRVGTIAGFDLKKFNEFSPVTVFPTEWRIDLEYQSDPFDIFDFNFQKDSEFPPQSSRLHIPVTRSGKCYGILQWLRLRLYDDIFYENDPHDAGCTDHTAGHWRWALHTFPIPLNLHAGQRLEIHATHNRNQLMFVVEN